MLLKTAQFDDLLFGLCDKSKFKIAKRFAGKLIQDPNCIKSPDLIIIAVFDPRVTRAIEIESKKLYPNAKTLSIIDFSEVNHS